MVKNAATVAAVAALCCQSAMSFSTVGGATHKRPRAQVACNVQQQQYEYPIPSLPQKEQVPSRKSAISSWVSSDEVPLDDRRRSKLLSFPVEADGLRNVDQRIVAEIIKDPKIEVIDTFLVLLSCFLAAVSTSNTVDLKTMAQIIRVENVIAYMFAAEFFVRWFSDFSWKGILGYLSRPLVLVDILVVIVPLLPIIIPNNAEAYNILPSWLTSTSGLINLRLLRVLRLQRVLQSMDTFAEFTEALGYEKTEIKPYKLQLARVVISVFTLLSISSGLIYTTEHNVNPDIPDYFTALYFGLTTLTTVGFGDIVVISPEGRFVVCASILAGVAVIPAQAAALVEALLERETYKNAAGTKNTLQSTGLPPGSPDQSISAAMSDVVCPKCGSGKHWRASQFCWNCGSSLYEESTLE